LESGQSQTLGKSQDGGGTLDCTQYTPKPESPKQGKGHSAQQFCYVLPLHERLYVYKLTDLN